MDSFAVFGRRGARSAGIAVVTLTVFAALTVAPTVQAAPDPCAASEVAKTAGSVATATGTYLETHPQTNTALTMISQQQGGAQSLGALKSYFDANPMVAADLQRLQQPLASLGARCQLPITLPQVLGLMQATQQQVPAPTGQGPAPGAQPVSAR